MARVMAYQAEIYEIGKDQTRCKLLKSFALFGEPRNKVSLAVGIIKPAHWEIMLEKAVELGVHDIYPLKTRYTVLPDIKRERKRKNHIIGTKTKRPILFTCSASSCFLYGFYFCQTQ